MFNQKKLVLADIGTSKTDICSELNLNQVHSYPTLIAYDDKGTYIGDNALQRAGAADLVWLKDSARLSRRELQLHPEAFTDFVRISLNRMNIQPPVDLLMSEPALMTTAARDHIISQISEVKGIKRVYFLPELMATAFSQNTPFKFILLDMGDGNTSVQAFNNKAPIQGAQQTFRAGRTMTYQTAEVLRQYYDIDYDLESAGSRNYRYILNLKQIILSDKKSVNIIDQNNDIRQIPITPLLQRRITSCLFESNSEYRPIHEIIKNVAFAVKDLSPELLKTIYLTGRTFTSQAVMNLFSEEINRLLEKEKKGIGLQKINVTRVENHAHSVIDGMRILGKQVQENSSKWIDING